MYIGPHRKKRQPSWVLIILLLVLIAAGLYVLEMISRGQIERPFEPTPIPTRSARNTSPSSFPTVSLRQLE